MLKLFRDKGYCVSDLKVLTVSCPITKDGNQEQFNGFLLTIPVPLQILVRNRYLEIKKCNIFASL